MPQFVLVQATWHLMELHPDLSSPAGQCFAGLQKEGHTRPARIVDENSNGCKCWTKAAHAHREAWHRLTLIISAEAQDAELLITRGPDIVGSIRSLLNCNPLQ